MVIIAEDIKLHAQLSQDAQKNYERELLLHAADVQAISSLKEKLQEADLQIKKLQA
jgi:hypothetical protein